MLPAHRIERESSFERAQIAPEDVAAPSVYIAQLDVIIAAPAPATRDAAAGDLGAGGSATAPGALDDTARGLESRRYLRRI